MVKERKVPQVLANRDIRTQDQKFAMDKAVLGLSREVLKTANERIPLKPIQIGQNSYKGIKWIFQCERQLLLKYRWDKDLCGYLVIEAFYLFGVRIYSHSPEVRTGITNTLREEFKVGLDNLDQVMSWLVAEVPDRFADTKTA